MDQTKADAHQERDPEAGDQLPLPGLTPVGKIVCEVLVDPAGHVHLIEVTERTPDGRLVAMTAYPSPTKARPETAIRWLRAELTDAFYRHVSPF